MPTTPVNVSSTLTAENTFTSELSADANTVITVFADFATGSFTGTVTLQRKLPGQSDFFDVTDDVGVSGFSAGVNIDYYNAERCDLRLGVKTGDFAGTSVACRLGKG
jgi:hypothetical protein